MFDLISYIAELYLIIKVPVARVRYVLFAFLLFIFARFLTITANYYRLQSTCDFFLSQFKSIILEYCIKESK